MEPGDTNVDIDQFQLLYVLSSLENDLQNPYAKSRPLFNDDIEAQMRHALSKVSHLEEDLKASIGISRILLSSVKSLQDNSAKTKEKLESLGQKLSDQVTENSKLKEELHAAEDKCFEIQHNFENLEEENARINSELRKSHREHSRKKLNLSLDATFLDPFAAEISELKNQYRETYESALKSKQEAEKELVLKNLKIQELKEIIASQQMRIDQAQLGLGTTMKLHSVNASTTDLESYHSHTNSRPSIKTDISKYEYEDSEIKGSLENEPFLPESATVKTFEIVTTDAILIKPKINHLPEFTEEIFFNMTLNCVKMNLTQFASLNVDCKELFRQALQTNVPMHKWNLWIESQLNLILLKNSSKVVSKIKR